MGERENYLLAGGVKETSQRRGCGWVWIPKRGGIEGRGDRRKAVTGTAGKEGPSCWERLAHRVIPNPTVSRSPLGAFD